ncbi:MAG TPA: tetratricopeptide repeat protein [Deltaproteobacteria bacterium]|nr:tetratricopeptide repeat protein [Deltaproteobacteria bacterium]
MECTCVRKSALCSALFCLSLLCAALPAGQAFAGGIIEGNDLELLSHYYLRPVPKSVPDILERAMGSSELPERLAAGDDLSSLTYLFARVARDEPDLLPRYRELFEGGSHAGRVFLIRVLGQTGGGETADYLKARLDDPSCANERGEISKALALLPEGVDALQRPVEKPSDLDLLWSEFMVTGDPRAVERIIDVLEFPDLTRERLEDYLKAGRLDQKDGLVSAIRNYLWVLCDTDTGKVITYKDLDISLVVFSLRPEHPREAVRFIRETLRIDDKAFSLAALKTSAAWSLMSNAAKHPRLLDICTGNALTRSTPVKLALLCVPACFHEDHLQVDEAVEAFRKMAEADPTNLDVHLHLMRLAIERRDLDAALREFSVFQENGIDPGRGPGRELRFLEKLLLGPDRLRNTGEALDVAGVVREMARATGLLRSYASELYVIPYPSSGRSRSAVRFRMECERPDRFSVSRRYCRDSSSPPGNDRWITLGPDNYAQLKTWVKVPVPAGGHGKTNAMLRIEKWAALLEANAVTEAKVFEGRGKRYYCLKFPVKHGEETLSDLIAEGKKATAEIWIDAGTHIIVKGEIASRARDARGNELGLTLEQVFDDFDSAGPIGPPEAYTDLSGFKGVM